MGRLNVSVAQINPQLCELDTNLSMHRHWIQQARDQQAELLLFPELSLTGYQVGRRAPAMAMKRDDPRLQVLARESGDMVSWVGFIESAGPGEYYNAMAALQQGRVIGVHRKLNLPTYGGLEEGKWFHAGQDLDLYSCAPDWQAACMICADMWNPALVHCAMLQRPDLLLSPANSASAIVSDHFSNEQNWAVNLQFYAMIYGMPVLMANRYGPEGDAHFWGGSRILGPRGEILALAEDQECLIMAQLDAEQTAAARFDHPAIRDANTALVQRLLKTIG